MKTLDKIYKVGNKEFLFDIKSLQYSFKQYKNYNDEEFLNDIENILHFAVYMCWLKEIPSDICLSDDGIVHQLVHLLKRSTKKHSDIKEIRKNFNKFLKI